VPPLVDSCCCERPLAVLLRETACSRSFESRSKAARPTTAAESTRERARRHERGRASQQVQQEVPSAAEKLERRRRWTAGRGPCASREALCSLAWLRRALRRSRSSSTSQSQSVFAPLSKEAALSELTLARKCRSARLTLSRSPGALLSTADGRASSIRCESSSFAAGAARDAIAA